jgi:heat-inducible transcriptional repressor
MQARFPAPAPCARGGASPFSAAMPAPGETPAVEASVLANLDARAREIFRRIVDSYLASGEPVGSRHLSRMLPISLSPASVRNVMQDLEELGLVYAPHTSAGRLPTQLGLRFYVDALLEFGGLGREERARIDNQVRAAAEEAGFEGALTEATALLSDLTHGAGVVVTSKDNVRLKHVEFVRLDPERALAVLVGEDGSVENRVVATPAGMPASTLAEAANYLNAQVRGRTLAEAREEVARARETARGELDALAARLVDAGLASWAGAEEASRQLIVRGQANLIADLHADADLERIRRLFADLETQTDVIDLLHRAENGEGVKIFIGAENKLFSLSGSSMIAAPLRGGDRRAAGVLGVIGPTRLNYGRIVPMVEYAAQVLGDLKRSR